MLCIAEEDAIVFGFAQQRYLCGMRDVVVSDRFRGIVNVEFNFFSQVGKVIFASLVLRKMATQRFLQLSA